jgi:hypothetical protein
MSIEFLYVDDLFTEAIGWDQLIFIKKSLIL